MGHKIVFSDKVRRTLVEMITVGEEVIFVLEELEHAFGYQSTYKRLYRTLHQFMDQGELTRQSHNRYKLTEKGVIKLLPMIKPALARDGKVRILVFDVPENRKLCRDRFRRHIRMLGFTLHQKSVWVSRYNCEKWLLKVADYHRIKDCVSLYIGEHVW